MSEDQKRTEPLLWEQEFLLLLSSIEKEYFQTTSDAKFDALVRYHTLVAIGGFVGPRAKEFLNLTWFDVVGKDEGQIFQFKQGRPREVYFNPQLIEMVDGNFSQVNPTNIHHLILHKQGEPYTPIKTQQFNQGFARRLEKAKVKTRQPSSHTLRKTFGMHIYRDIHQGSEEGLIMACKMLDHRSIEETMKYIGLTDARIKETFMKF